MHVVVVVFPKKSHVYGIVKAATLELGLHSACLEMLLRQSVDAKERAEAQEGKQKKTLTNTKVPNMLHKLLTELATVSRLRIRIFCCAGNLGVGR